MGRTPLLLMVGGTGRIKKSFFHVTHFENIQQTHEAGVSVTSTESKQAQGLTVELHRDRQHGQPGFSHSKLHTSPNKCYNFKDTRNTISSD